MLTWTKYVRGGQLDASASEGYRTELPGWGEVKIYPHIHHVGTMFLDCLALGIDRCPLGKLKLEDAIVPAEAMLVQTLEEHISMCKNGLDALRRE